MLAPAAHHTLLSILVVTSPAPDVWLSILTDYTYDSELDIADGVPLAFRRSSMFPEGNCTSHSDQVCELIATLIMKSHERSKKSKAGFQSFHLKKNLTKHILIFLSFVLLFCTMVKVLFHLHHSKRVARFFTYFPLCFPT